MSQHQPKLMIQHEIDNVDALGMGFFEHLSELRKRLMIAFIAIIIGTIIATIFASHVLELLRAPYCLVSDSPEDCRLMILSPTDNVGVYFRVSLTLGAIIAVPVITYQFFLFVIPGLTRREQRLIWLALPAITGLFLAGVAFAWFILIPPALGFLEGFEPSLFRSEWTAELYIGFVTSLVFWMGIAFETPLVFFVLALLGVIEAATLIRNWRLAIVIAAIVSAVITPTVDPVNMFLVMGPIAFLYLISIGLVVIGRRIIRIKPNNA